MRRVVSYHKIIILSLAFVLTAMVATSANSETVTNVALDKTVTLDGFFNGVRC